MENQLDIMIKELLEWNTIDPEQVSGRDDKEELVRTLMTISPPGLGSESYFEAEAEYLKTELNACPVTSVGDIRNELLPGIYLYQGDITLIEADAIVNAANEKLLGCFVPGHHCIDNAIQMRSGLKLRNACGVIMSKQGHDEEVGLAKVTPGFSLPAKYVVHTVGPNIHTMKAPTVQKVERQLSSCYRSILEELLEYEDVKTIVFCSISTGVYGVPIEFASRVALDTISKFIESRPGRYDKVIIDVFSDRDRKAYEESASLFI